MCRARLDFRFAALFLWMMLVLANLSSIFCTFGYKAVALYPKVQKMLDKLAKTNIIHKNKAANLKSSLALHISKLG